MKLWRYRAVILVLSLMNRKVEACERVGFLASRFTERGPLLNKHSK